MAKVVLFLFLCGTAASSAKGVGGPTVCSPCAMRRSDIKKGIEEEGKIVKL